MSDVHTPQNCPLSTRLDAVREDLADVKALVGRMADAVERLTRLEERHNNTSAALDRAFSALSKLADRIQVLDVRVAGLSGIANLEDRVVRLEQAQPDQTRTSRWVDRAVWALASAAVMYLLKQGGLL